MGMETKNLQVKYGDKVVLKDANFKVNNGEIVTIIGPNGSGKTTLIKALSRCIKSHSGDIYLDGKDIYQIPTKKIAREVAILPQVKNVSADVTIENLVSYGRYPHLGFGKRIKKDDRDIIHWAIEKTGLIKLRDRYIATLSGGERQRAWIAMALAQKPKILILDEPTTYLDISYQLEVLELVKELNESLGITVIMVLHDLNQAARYSDNIYVLRDGQICECGKPNNILQTKMLKDVFRIEAHIYQDEINDCPYFIPHKLKDSE
ncbi:ABC transporter ATP-binding protein [Tissierella carlieri]|uniref:ABC transporter ATP-binding protein n=1 Tax=Tissierella carlieri TaxID=689904 RepID=A0ABT1S8P8_9FIRM|nr:ABC transporter ATP-binding protein [Tissierella carlieri]MBU5312431.1 ABC transporter ATP-binding protein [Tissierella carlieri]MCQ4922838.1 ABC transporter ATP-binding protein [Tissierella carlieri]